MKKVTTKPNGQNDEKKTIKFASAWFFSVYGCLAIIWLYIVWSSSLSILSLQFCSKHIATFYDTPNSTFSYWNGIKLHRNIDRRRKTRGRNKRQKKTNMRKGTCWENKRSFVFFSNNVQHPINHSKISIHIFCAMQKNKWFSCESVCLLQNITSYLSLQINIILRYVLQTAETSFKRAHTAQTAAQFFFWYCFNAIAFSHLPFITSKFLISLHTIHAFPYVLGWQFSRMPNIIIHHVEINTHIQIHTPQLVRCNEFARFAVRQ